LSIVGKIKVHEAGREEREGLRKTTRRKRTASKRKKEENKEQNSMQELSTLDVCWQADSSKDGDGQHRPRDTRRH
jgi:hypothetical protein